MKRYISERTYSLNLPQFFLFYPIVESNKPCFINVSIPEIFVIAPKIEDAIIFFFFFLVSIGVIIENRFSYRLSILSFQSRISNFRLIFNEIFSLFLKKALP